eukprot:4715372-Lingulodinium_polyedra.AAC.1
MDESKTPNSTPEARWQTCQGTSPCAVCRPRPWEPPPRPRRRLAIKSKLAAITTGARPTEAPPTEARP